MENLNLRHWNILRFFITFLQRPFRRIVGMTGFREALSLLLLIPIASSFAQSDTQKRNSFILKGTYGCEWGGGPLFSMMTYFEDGTYIDAWYIRVPNGETEKVIPGGNSMGTFRQESASIFLDRRTVFNKDDSKNVGAPNLRRHLKIARISGGSYELSETKRFLNNVEDRPDNLKLTCEPVPEAFLGMSTMRRKLPDRYFF
jgi:hypothetical protein